MKMVKRIFAGMAAAVMAFSTMSIGANAYTQKDTWGVNYVYGNPNMSYPDSCTFYTYGNGYKTYCSSITGSNDRRIEVTYGDSAHEYLITTTGYSSTKYYPTSASTITFTFTARGEVMCSGSGSVGYNT